MASSLMHYAITDKILQLFPMHDGARLRFGAVLPDASVNKRKTHFRVYNEKLGIRLYDLEAYRAQFGERMQKDDLYLGYYLHLIEDALYRKTLYDTFGWNPYTPESTARMHHDYTLLNRHFIQKYNIRDDLAVPENFTQELIFAFEPFDAEGLLRSIHQNFVPAPADAPTFSRLPWRTRTLKTPCGYAPQSLTAFTAAKRFFPPRISPGRHRKTIRISE